MKEFVKENKVVVVILGVIIILAIVASVIGIVKLVSKDDKKLENNNNETNVSKKGKYDSINDAKEYVNSESIEELYDYVLGIGYMKDDKYVSEIYTTGIVKYTDLSNESILRAGINQIALCDSQYKELSTSLVLDKVKQIFNKTLTDIDIKVDMGTGIYNCNNSSCVLEGSYCVNKPLSNGNKLVSVSTDFNDKNILYLYEETKDDLMYRHIFKNSEGKYYYTATEILGK